VNFPQGRAFCDTSFFFASLYPGDTNYNRAGDILAECLERSVTLHTTWDVVSETVTLLRYRANYKKAVQFLDVIKPSLAIVRYDDSVRSAAEEGFKKLSKDKKHSYCDALSFVMITGLLDNMPCLTFDHDFRSLGLIVYPE
jgi:predicted nucleic acid-binding protein